MADDHDSSAYEPYSVRKRGRERQGQSVIYRYDYLPTPLLVQVTQILDGAIGKNKGYSEVYPKPSEIWERIHNFVAHELGLLDLNVYRKREADRNAFITFLVESSHVQNFEGNETLEAQLDAIEMAFLVLSDTDFDLNHRMVYGARFTVDDAVRELNRRFRQHDIGYQLKDGIIIESDSEFTFTEIIEPAIDFLREEGFEQAHDEFLRAHQHFRRGEMADALIDANNALESTLKVALERSGVTLAGNETANVLVQKSTQSILPAHMRTQLESLRKVMETVSSMRNKPGIGHGAGSVEVEVLDTLAEYALDVTASTIKLVIRRIHE